MSEDLFAIGVDLGGTKIEVAAVDLQGKILERKRVPTDVQGGPEAIQTQIADTVKDLMGKHPVGVGVGVAGQIDSDSGVVHFAPNLQWHEVPMQETLSQALGVPVAVTNDVRAATWGEWVHGAGKGCDDFICIFLGTGIGGGVVSGGKMLKGSSNAAGEIGHTTVDLYGPACTCGNRGCLEAFGGGWAIARSAKEAAISNPDAAKHMLKLVQGDEEALTAKIVIQAAREEDPLAQGILDKVFEAYVAGAVSFINAFNPSRLIFGGGLADGMPEIVEIVDAGVRGRALKAATESLEVMPAILKNEAGVIGAATFAMKKFKGV